MKIHAPPAEKGPHRDPAKERIWRERIEQFAASGRSVREFCTAQGLRETAFYFWRSEIQRRDGQVQPRRQQTRSRSRRRVGFARVVVRSPQPAVQDGLRLQLGGGRELLLPASMALEQVARLIRAIEVVA
ncbi:MAG TPA: hypothetical protein VG742_15135 [Dongiaceae bacterium]|jgi:hypothetical protein|nr:hypothetical protein [Dongiaceae bacterium]